MAMLDQRSSRIDLFTAMVSGDVIVLAKLVRTLRPRRVVVFSTAYGRERGWEENVRRMLTDIQPRMIDQFDVAPLPDDDFGLQLERFGRVVQAEFCGLSQGATVAFDCTTGQGIFHI